MKKIIALAMAILIAAISIPLSLASDLNGDVNDDNKVNSSDALVILQSVVGLYTGEISLKNGDLNNDKQINSTDALIVLQICVGLIEPTSKETTTATKPTETTTKTTTSTTTKSSTKATTTTTNKDDEELSYKVGDKLNCEFDSKYIIRLYSDGSTTYIPAGSVADDTTGKDYKDYILNLDSYEAKISKIDDIQKPYSYYDENLNLVTGYEREITNYVSATFKGHTDKALSGKCLFFELRQCVRRPYDIDENGELVYEWEHLGTMRYNFDINHTSDNTIDSNGNFEFTVVFEKKGNMDWCLDGKYTIDDISTLSTKSAWDDFVFEYNMY